LLLALFARAISEEEPYGIPQGEIFPTPRQCSSRNLDLELKNGSGCYLEGLIAGARFEPTTLLSKFLDNTALFFLCILVAKVETVILS
jgi:hypothetical protein